MQIWTPSIMAFIGVTGLVFSTVFVFRYAWKAESRLRAFSQNASLHVDDRLAGVLAKKLGDRWTVAVLARNGWNTTQEYEALVKHPKKPRQIVFSYFLNDIESTARANGYVGPKLRGIPNNTILYFMHQSFILSWLHTRFYITSAVGGVYFDYLQQVYDNPKIWDSHKRELDGIINYARQIESEIIFIVWPFLTRIDESLHLTSRVVAYLSEQQIEVIDLAKHFAGRDPDSLIVSPLNSHPSVQANREVA